MSINQEVYQEYLKHPSQHFANPRDVLQVEELDDEQKFEILQSWKLDEEELSVATEENMPGRSTSRVAEVVDALGKLNLPRQIDPGDDK